MADVARVIRPTPSRSTPNASLIIPAYNEAGRIAAGVLRLRAAAELGAIDLEHTEVLWVDDGSSDDTASSAEAAAATLPHGGVVVLAANHGKGGAVRAGIELAAGERLAFCDADMSINPIHLGELLSALDGADVAIGSRAASGGIDYGAPWRTFAGRAFNRVVNGFTGLQLRDTQCGMKAFTRAAGRLLFASTALERFAFDVELLTRSRQYGLQVVEVPVSWDEITGSSVRPLADPTSMLYDLCRSHFGLDRSMPVFALELDRPIEAPQLAARVANVAQHHDLVIATGAGRSLVLFPFMSGAAKWNAAAQVRAALSPASALDRYFSVRDLAKLAPLRLSS